MSNPSRRRIALFGGSFNPPHICHTMATLWVLQTRDVDEVWWIPTYQHAFSKELASFDDRFRMCELAIEALSGVSVVDIERRMGGESRTLQTVKELMSLHPDADFSLVIGADILGEVHRWENWEGLLELVSLIIVGRQGYDRNRPEQGIDLELPDISSTVIRNALASCEYSQVDAWIPRRVLEYIDERKLYLGEVCR